MQKLGFIDKTMMLLHKVIELREQNHQIIASNIANADTPGYIPTRLEFEDRLREAVNSAPQTSQPVSSHSTHFQINTAMDLEEVQGQIIRDRSNFLSTGDGNEVDKNQEMVILAENQILYEAAAQLLTKKFGLIKYVTEQSAK